MMSAVSLDIKFYSLYSDAVMRIKIKKTIQSIPFGED